ALTIGSRTALHPTRNGISRLGGPAAYFALRRALMCPALAARHAAPWSRKISATSSFGREDHASLELGDGCHLLQQDFARCALDHRKIGKPTSTPASSSRQKRNGAGKPVN